MRTADLITYTGSAAAMVAGSAVSLHAQTAPPSAESNHFALAGLVTALGGLAAAIYPQVQLALKLWLEERRQSRESTSGRDRIENELRIAQSQIEELRQSEHELGVTLQYNREVVAAFARKLDLELPPLPTIPDRHPAPATPPRRATGQVTETPAE